ncbi:hypothetical protein ASF49_21400 [Methylobacterium sp. Leaf104]|uniref:hypothetical protein n=1 Tax=Methylobacterium TaxID=407 RepID=UPI0006FC973E|nr:MULTISPECIES: hypothetical protein [Methylobacterium]KQP40061.1 hypothetical protein ASF49_21400 [Methylobacterium sp. Leaf104]MCI9881944.1 hypothetical protein [Methylobacterium goesingense]
MSPEGEPVSDEAARLLAEIHAARGLLRTASDAVRPSAAALWTHVLREPGAPVDLALVRAIRTDPETARRYRALLAGQALAHAPLAIAAAHGPVSSRRIGPFALQILAGTEDAPPLLIVQTVGIRPPRLIEAILGDETRRLALPPPVNGVILLALDPAVPEASRLGDMLQDPACAVFLL